MRAGMRLVIEHDEEAAVDKQSLLDALWEILLDDRDGKVLINHSYMTATVVGWPDWDDITPDSRKLRVRMRDWDHEAVGQQLIRGQMTKGISHVRLHTPFDWRILLTRVTNLEGDTVRYDREVVITLASMNKLIGQHAGRALQASDWIEVHDALLINGAVAGVKSDKPKRYVTQGRGRCRTSINVQEGLPAQTAPSCLALYFPPLKPSEVTPA